MVNAPFVRYPQTNVITCLMVLIVDCKWRLARSS